MTKSKKQPKIFLSYSWKNNSIADEIDNTFRKFGINFQRDVRDIEFRDSIKEFMKKIGKSNYVIMIISDEFLKSPNCMYEVMELTNSKNYKKRILPIVLTNAKIYNKIEQVQYIQYWENVLDKIKEKISEVKLEHATGLDEHLKVINNICSNISEFLKDISDINNKTYDDHKASNFKEILRILKINPEDFPEELLEIAEIVDLEDKQIKLEEYLRKEPSSPYGNLYKADLYKEKKEFKMARNIYEYYINNFNVNLDIAYNDLGVLLKNHFNDFEGANNNYDNAIKINPENDSSYYNKGLLLKTHFKDYKGAKKNYEKAIKINPQYASSYYNLAILLHKELMDYDGAKKNYEKVIEINPQDDMAFNNLGALLFEKFEDYQRAKEYFEKAIKINPQYAQAYYNLGKLYDSVYEDSENSKFNYLKAIELDKNLQSDVLDKYFGITKNE